MEEGKSFVLYIRILRIIRKKKLCNYEIVFFFRWRGPFRTFLLEKLKFRSIIYAQTKRVLFELHEFLCMICNGTCNKLFWKFGSHLC